MDGLTEATAEHAWACSRAADTRARLHREILAALARGITQADISRATGYSRERLRQIARAEAGGPQP